MIQIAVTKQVDSPADKVWEKVASFSGIEDYSPIARSVVKGNGVGAKRTCYMPDDAEIHEALSMVDHDNMHLEYEMFSGPFQLRITREKLRLSR